MQSTPAPADNNVHPPLPPADNVEAAIDEEEKRDSTNVYSGVTASSREKRKLKSKRKVARCTPAEKILATLMVEHPTKKEYCF